MNNKIKIIIVAVVLIAVMAIINVFKTNQLNQKLETENKQSKQLLVEFQEKQNEKVTRELTDLLQDVEFIMDIDSNCPPDEMINQIKKLYNNEKDFDKMIQANYEKILNQIELQNCN